MAEPISSLVIKTVCKDCPSNTCPYRQGDGIHSKRVATKLDANLKHRVADGAEVRKLEKELLALKLVVAKILEIARKRKLNPQEIKHLENALKIEQK